MINPQSISEQLLFSTVRIEAIKTNGHKSTGTAFHYTLELGQGRQIKLLVTNKHVIANTKSGSFFLHEGQQSGEQFIPSGKSLYVHLDSFEQWWIPHPQKDIDLCAMPLQPLIENAATQGKSIYHKSITAEIIPSLKDLEDLRAVESILMVGYPNGLWDTTNNLPLVRRGITATHPAIDFKGRPISVIDMACFPGSSGSPVLIVDEGSYVNKAGCLMAGVNRLICLGVLYAGPSFTAKGEIITKEIPTEDTEVPTGNISLSQTPVMIHLGYIVKARELIVLGEAVRAYARSRGENID
jgi:hypothetical protein